MTDTVVVVVNEQPVATLDSSTTLEVLTDGIKYYLREMGKNVIEIGKRLILAKEKIPHGEWQNWLADNFNLKYRMAANFMEISRRFSEVQSTAHLSQTQMTEMLLLPEGEEEKFIAEKKAEGTPVADMSVKRLREEIKKYKATLTVSVVTSAKAESSTALTEISITEGKTQTTALLSSLQVTEELVRQDEVSVEETRDIERFGSSVVEKHEQTEGLPTHQSSFDDSVVEDKQQSTQPAIPANTILVTLFDTVSSLLNKENLSGLVAQYADKNVQSLETKLTQLAALHTELQNYLEMWKAQKDAPYTDNVDSVDVDATVVVHETDVSEVKTTEIDETENKVTEPSVAGEELDKHAIISALHQISLNDDKNFSKTRQVQSRIQALGFDCVQQVSTADLQAILNEVSSP